MNLFDPRTLPFLTRNMLAFEQQTTFQLVIVTQSLSTNPITIRGFTKDGPFTLRHAPDGTGAEFSETFNIPDIPIMVSVIDDGSFYTPGELFARLSLALNGDVVQQLCSGYVYSQSGLSWPYSNLKDPAANIGLVQGDTGTDPGAGNEVAYPVNNNFTIELYAVRIPFVTSAAVANRRVHLVIETGAGDVIDVFSDIDQTASQTREYTFAPFGFAEDRLDDNDILVGLPGGLILSPDCVLKTVTTNLQAGDDFGAPIVYGKYCFTA